MGGPPHLMEVDSHGATVDLSAGAPHCSAPCKAAASLSSHCVVVTDLQGKGAEREGEGRGAWEGSWGGRKSREERGSEGRMEESRGRTGDSGKRMEKGSSGGREKSRENGEKIRMSMTSSPSGRNTNRW